MSVIDDQRLSGAIMWIAGSMMYLLAALILLGRMLGEEEAKTPLPANQWGTDETGDGRLRAPGFEEGDTSPGKTR